MGLLVLGWSGVQFGIPFGIDSRKWQPRRLGLRFQAPISEVEWISSYLPGLTYFSCRLYNLSRKMYDETKSPLHTVSPENGFRTSLDPQSSVQRPEPVETGRALPGLAHRVFGFSALRANPRAMSASAGAVGSNSDGHKTAQGSQGALCYFFLRVCACCRGEN